MRSDSFVGFRVVDVSDDKDAVEPRQDGTFEFDLLLQSLVVVKASENRVGSCKD